MGAVLLWATGAFAQETRGMIFGHVLDPSGAAVAGAAVTVRNTGTNVLTELKTNEAGYYEAALLVAGNYQVSVESASFRKAVHDAFDLPVASRLQVDFRLELGAVTDAVTVVAEAPLLNSNTLSSGQVLNSRTIIDVPLPGGNSITLAKMAPGVQSAQSLADTSVMLHSTSAGSNYTTAGGVGGNEYSIDGTSNNGASRQPGFMLAPELVQEFKVEVSGFDVSFGHSTGISVSVMTKSGTNQYHGSLRETNHENQFDAMQFFTKQAYYNQVAAALAAGNPTLAKQIKPGGKTHGNENQFAGTLGGPIVLPKIFNGKDKLFFFFGYQGFRLVTYNSGYSAVPTTPMRTGNFSQLLNINPSLYQLYDPLTVQPDSARPGHVVRSPFPGNIVPQNRTINPMYKFYDSLLPAPNTLSANPAVEPAQDYMAYSERAPNVYNAETNRIDYNLSPRDRFFFRWSYNEWSNAGSEGWLYASSMPELTTSGQLRNNLGAGVDWVHTFGATTLLDVSLSANRYRSTNVDPGFLALKPSSAGLPAYMDLLASSQPVLPNVSWSGWSSVSQPLSLSVSRYRVMAGKADLSHMTNRHTIKAGLDARGQYYTGFAPGNNAGSFSFTSTWTQRTDDGYQSAGTGSYGGSWASFMMGLPASMTIDNNASIALANPYYAAYVQDNWRPTEKLSVNFGLRMEYEMGPTERYNRMIGNFNPTATLPITDAGQAAYSKNPVPQVPASQFSVLGGSMYPGVGGADRKLYGNALNWLPRLSAAYQLTPKMVVRAGVGMFYDTLNVQNETVTQNQLGFSQSTSTTISNNFGQNWLVGNPAAGVSPLTDPFPIMSNGLRELQPAGSSLGLMAVVGKSFTFVPYDRPHARQTRWRLDLQRELGHSMVFNVGYSGSYSDHLPVNQTLNALPAQYWSYATTRNNTVANSLNANVTNPYYVGNFAGLQTSNPALYQYMAANSFFSSSTIRASALLGPFSQMSGLTETVALGRAKTQELDMSFERRFTKGVALNVSYTRLYNYAADYFPNSFDTSPAWEPSNTGRPWRLASTAVFELPIGKNRRWFQSGPVSWLMGGFQFSVIEEYQPGALNTWSGTTYYSGNLSDICNTGPHTLGQWFNTSGFVTDATLASTTGQARVFPNIVNGGGGCRADALKNFNVDAARDFHLREHMTLQFRFDVINALNHTIFSNPNTTATSTQFGQVLSQIGNNRVIEVQGRVMF
jgi:hypothetical protein